MNEINASPGSQASYGAGGGQLAKDGVVQETEECPHGATRMTGAGLKCALCGELLETERTYPLQETEQDDPHSPEGAVWRMADWRDPEASGLLGYRSISVLYNAGQAGMHSGKVRIYGDAAETERYAHWMLSALNALAGVADPAAELARLREREALVGRLVEALDNAARRSHRDRADLWKGAAHSDIYADCPDPSCPTNRALLAEARGEAPR